MDFTSKVISYINQHQLCSQGAKLIVGVSGGADSVALLHLLHNSGYQCIVAHCNFHLREKDSDDDATFVRNLARKWQLPFFSTDFDTQSIAKEQGISIEMAARDLRYNWFTTLRQTEKAEAIAVAHHLDDSIETFFINLSRGTGLRGLLGIQPKQGCIIRPLLSINRSEIDKYIKNNELNFRIDCTNFDQAIIRNKIRHSILPLFESFNPSFKQVMADNFARLDELNNVANAIVEEFRNNAVANHNSYFSISIEKLKQQDNIHFLLFELLKPYLFNDATVNDILLHLDSESGKQFFSATHRAIKDRNQLLICKIEPTDDNIYLIPEGTSSIHFPVQLTFSEPFDADLSTIVRQKEIACVDFDKLAFPLGIRHPEEGDFFYPFGNQGKKKLSNFFIDQKWNLLEKEKCWLLISDKQIVWIIGHRLDNRFRVDFKKKKKLKISFYGSI